MGEDCPFVPPVPLPTVGALRELLEIKTNRQLGWMLLACVATDKRDGPYTTFSIPKRSGGERVVHAPKWRLKLAQRMIYEKILRPLEMHRACHGFLPGRSIVTNAERHVRVTMLVKFDLENFFPSIRFRRVREFFEGLGYAAGDGRFSASDQSINVAATLARLCCLSEHPKRWGKSVLPQGAPTSPSIANACAYNMDARLDFLASDNGGVYTRYADDLTFSYAGAPDKGFVGTMRYYVDKIVRSERFRLNPDKFRVIRHSRRQLVTGIVVNDRPRLAKPERRRLRAILHNCETNGIAAESYGDPKFLSKLTGKCAFLNMVDPKAGAVALDRIRRLTETSHVGQAPAPDGVPADG